MRLYRIPFSTNVERVSLALAHKGLGVESVWVDPADRREVREVSGQELVPVLVHDGRTLVESMDIVAYLESLQPDPPLYPAGAARRAELDLFVDWFNRVWKRPPNEIESELRSAEPDRRRIDALARSMTDVLALFEALLEDRDHLFGDDFSAADCCAFPFLKYALIHDPADRELFHDILRSFQPISGYPRLAAWIERVDARPRV